MLQGPCMVTEMHIVGTWAILWRQGVFILPCVHLLKFAFVNNLTQKLKDTFDWMILQEVVAPTYIQLKFGGGYFLKDSLTMGHFYTFYLITLEIVKAPGFKKLDLLDLVNKRTHILIAVNFTQPLWPR